MGQPGSGLVVKAVAVAEEAGGEGAKDDAGYVSDVSHTARLGSRDRSHVEKLGDEPDTNQKRGGDHGDAHEDENEEKRANAIVRISHEECAHERGNGAAGQ